jgi:hypothetical protein
MTTPTDFQRWHARALALADECETAALNYWHALGDEHADALRALREARAALSAHLLAVPMGEPVGYWLDGTSVADMSGKNPGEEADDWWRPLFTKPEGIA